MDHGGAWIAAATAAAGLDGRRHLRGQGNELWFLAAPDAAGHRPCGRDPVAQREAPLHAAGQFVLRVPAATLASGIVQP